MGGTKLNGIVEQCECCFIRQLLAIRNTQTLRLKCSEAGSITFNRSTHHEAKANRRDEGTILAECACCHCGRTVGGDCDGKR